jgi:Ca2+-binding RTX toxin-like protein
MSVKAFALFTASSVLLLDGCDNVENLTLIGAALFGGGNDLSNVITGNAFANTLKGYGGNNRISGAGGNDNLNGGSGYDSLDGGAVGDTLSDKDY